MDIGDAFKLNSEIYLSALWNKLFDNDIIKENNIKFDLSLSMGEDFRFSVEYLDKAESRAVYAISESLYNYRKASEESLISNYGLSGIESAKENLKLLRNLAQKTNPCADLLYEKSLRK